MLGLFCGLALLACITFSVMRVKYPIKNEYGDNVLTPLALLFGAIFLAFFIFIAIFIAQVANERVIDSKIEMYQELNQEIEQDIDQMVQQYMSHEKNTFNDLKTEGTITLVSLFPELKSDTLVQRQLEIYVANTEKIKALKEEKIELSQTKWLLYFGK